METTYILTAEMDDDSFASLDGLRRRHFPQERNFLPAQVSDTGDDGSNLEEPREIKFLLESAAL
jgi:hypothetical protein